MADPLSIVAAVTGITVAAIKSVQKLLQFIEAIQEAPVAIANIREDLQAVDTILRCLNRALQDPQLSDVLKTKWNGTLQSAVQSCQDLSIEFSTVLQHWMKHSTENKTFWSDRVKVGYFGETKMNKFRAKLSKCKATVSMALETSNLYILPSIIETETNNVC
jgi:Fungal N-terminal domain of STAND proteins